MIPKNQITENLYTPGGEFIDILNKEYSGFYCIIKGKYYIGKTFKFNNQPLIKIIQKNNKSIVKSNENYLSGK